MPLHRTLTLLVCTALIVAAAPLVGQTATGDAGALPQLGPFQHHQQLVATYDSVADSTQLAVVTHKGKYFLWIQHPRLTWTVSYAGRQPGIDPPGEIILLFRTQNPQAARDNRLVLEIAPGERIEVASVSAYSDPGPMISSHFMRFPIPTSELARALVNQTMTLSVGGIRVQFKPDQMEAVRDLLSRVGAWPPVAPPAGASQADTVGTNR
jgi:hypothetical protein